MMEQMTVRAIGGASDRPSTARAGPDGATQQRSGRPAAAAEG